LAKFDITCTELLDGFSHETLYPDHLQQSQLEFIWGTILGKPKQWAEWLSRTCKILYKPCASRSTSLESIHLQQFTMVSLKLSSLIALVMANTVFQNIDAASISSRDTTSKYPKQPRSSSGGNCIGFTQKFAPGTDMSQYWADQSDAPGAWELTSNALELKVLKPSKRLSHVTLSNCHPFLEYLFVGV
jgi:hypothetical protein